MMNYIPLSITALFISLSSLSQASTVMYTQDFSGPVTATPTYQNTLTFGDGKQVEDQGFGYGGPNHYQDTDFVEDMSFYSYNNNNRSLWMTTVLYLDTSSWAAGNYNVAFDVTGFTANADASRFGVYEGNNDGTLQLEINMVNEPVIGEDTPFEVDSTGTVSFDEVGSGAVITTGVTSINYDFTLTDAGSAGDFLVLGWSSTNPAAGTSGSDAFNVDNIIVTDVTAVPEPSSAALLGLGGLALILRRRK